MQRTSPHACVRVDTCHTMGSKRRYITFKIDDELPQLALDPAPAGSRVREPYGEKARRCVRLCGFCLACTGTIFQALVRCVVCLYPQYSVTYDGIGILWRLKHRWPMHHRRLRGCCASSSSWRCCYYSCCSCCHDTHRIRALNSAIELKTLLFLAAYVTPSLLAATHMAARR